MYDSESADIYLNDAIATNDLPWLCMAPCCRMLLGAQAPRRWHWMTRAGGGLVLFRSQNTRNILGFDRIVHQILGLKHISADLQ